MSLLQPVAEEVIRVRMLDTTIGCVVGLSGGLAIHSNRLRVPLRQIENWMLARFGQTTKH